MSLLPPKGLSRLKLLQILTTLRIKFSLSALAITCASIISTPLSYAQTDTDYSKLVFEPVLLSATNQQEAMALTDTAALTPAIPTSLQPSLSALDNSNNLKQYQQSIEALELSEGPFSKALSEQLVSLATLQYDVGNYDAAIEALEQAQHITRINNGLFTLDQMPIVQNIITNYIAQNDIKQIDKYQGYLYYINQRNYTGYAPEMLAATESWAQWNIEAFLKDPSFLHRSSLSFRQTSLSSPSNNLVAVRNPSTGSYYFIERDQIFGMNGLNSRGFSEFQARASAVSMKTLIDPHLQAARDLYENLLDPKNDNEFNSLNMLEKQNLQYQLANVNFQIMRQIDFMIADNTGSSSNLKGYQRRSNIPEVNRGFVKSRDALEMIVTALQNNENAHPADIASAQINLADWYLSFERSKNAFKLYQEASSILKAAGIPDDEISTFFSSTSPITVPAFASHQYSRQLWQSDTGDSVPYKGYIDLAFDYNQGRMRRVKIINTSADTPLPIRRLLLRKVRADKVRPFFTNGEIIEQADMTLRYYYTY